jgi:hypothetical protein
VEALGIWVVGKHSRRERILATSRQRGQRRKEFMLGEEEKL